MAINKCNFDFYLMHEGWLSEPPRQESQSDVQAPKESLAFIRMTEFSSDDKPDIWYKAEVLNVSERIEEVRKLLLQYGLPKAVLKNCSSQKVELEQRVSKRS